MQQIFSWRPAIALLLLYIQIGQRMKNIEKFTLTTFNMAKNVNVSIAITRQQRVVP